MYIIVNWVNWTTWSTYRQIGNTPQIVSCFRGTRFRTRRCEAGEHGTKCSDPEAKTHIDFDNEAGDDILTEWEIHNEFERDLIKSCGKKNDIK